MRLKGQENLGHLPATQLTSMLTERQKVIAEYLDSVRQLAESIRAYERRYEISSVEMIAELQQGEREETWEIADWVIDYERYRKATADWPELAETALAR